MPTGTALSGFTRQSDARSRTGAAGLRGRLREATAEAHACLDQELAALDLRRRADYRGFLEASAGALLPLEAALLEAGVVRLFPDWTLRSRRRSILHDLARLGGAPVPLAVPEALDDGRMLGVMYVLEGSRLGAAFLLRTVLTSTDPVVTGATSYLRHGAGQHLWPTMLAMLEHHEGTLADEAAAIDGARRAFDLFAHAAAQVCGSARVPAAQPRGSADAWI